MRAVSVHVHKIMITKWRFIQHWSATTKYWHCSSISICISAQNWSVFDGENCKMEADFW